MHIISIKGVDHLLVSDEEKLIDKFINLECIYVKKANCPWNGRLLELPKLNEMHFLTIEQEQLFKLLDEKKKKGKKSNVSLYMFGILVDSTDDVNSFYSEDDIDCVNRTQQIALNYSRTSPILPWIYAINYSTLVSILGKIPDDFHLRFMNLLTVKVHQKVDEKQFIEFLNKYQCLKTLQIRAEFSLNFYETLHVTCPMLESLFIEETEMFEIDFILKLKNLEKFCINFGEISFDQIEDYFAKLPLIYFRFYYKEKVVSIERDDSNNYHVEIGGEEAGFQDKNKMFNFLKIITSCSNAHSTDSAMDCSIDSAMDCSTKSIAN